jgi:hypothetical protein
MVGIRDVLAGAALIAVFTAQAIAQDSPQDYASALKTNCGQQIKTYCEGVIEGQGRLLSCLYAHEDKLPAICSVTVDASLERLGMMLAALASVAHVCEADAKRLCNGVEPGNGHLVDCLSKAHQSVSPQCNATLDMGFLRP